MKLSKIEMTKLETLINKAEGTDVNVIIQMIKSKQRNEQDGNWNVTASLLSAA
jgi:hypothetical protein